MEDKHYSTYKFEWPISDPAFALCLEGFASRWVRKLDFKIGNTLAVRRVEKLSR